MVQLRSQSSRALRDAGEWVTVQLPWHAFVPVNRARVDSDAPPLNPSSVRQLGLVRSFAQVRIIMLPLLLAAQRARLGQQC